MLVLLYLHSLFLCPREEEGRRLLNAPWHGQQAFREVVALSVHSQGGEARQAQLHFLHRDDDEALDKDTCKDDAVATYFAFPTLSYPPRMMTDGCSLPSGFEGSRRGDTATFRRNQLRRVRF